MKLVLLRRQTINTSSVKWDMWVTLGCLVRRFPLPIMVTYSCSRVRPCTCQAESRISVLMTLSGPDTQRPLLREWIQGDWGVRMWHRRCQSWVGGAVHESKSVYVCESGGRQEGGEVFGQIVHGAHPSGRG